MREREKEQRLENWEQMSTYEKSGGLQSRVKYKYKKSDMELKIHEQGWTQSFVENPEHSARQRRFPPLFYCLHNHFIMQPCLCEGEGWIHNRGRYQLTMVYFLIQNEQLKREVNGVYLTVGLQVCVQDKKHSHCVCLCGKK